jgi:intracellular septation protein
MSQLLEWAPLLAFFAVSKLANIYWATGVLMAAYVLLLFVHRLRTGKFKTMHIVIVAAVLVLGTATLLLHDVRFIQWKPTVLFGAAAVLFLGSMVIGKQPLAQRMLEGAFEHPMQVSPRAWQVLNLVWSVWFALLAVANIYVARNFSQDTWVNFKVFGTTIASVVFMLPQAFWLAGRIKEPPAVESS